MPISNGDKNADDKFPERRPLISIYNLFLKGQVASHAHPLASSSCVSDVTMVLLCVHNYHFPKLAQEVINTFGKNVNFLIKRNRYLLCKLELNSSWTFKRRVSTACDSPETLLFVDNRQKILLFLPNTLKPLLTTEIFIIEIQFRKYVFTNYKDLALLYWMDESTD